MQENSSEASNRPSSAICGNSGCALALWLPERFRSSRVALYPAMAAQPRICSGDAVSTMHPAHASGRRWLASRAHSQSAPAALLDCGPGCGPSAHVCWMDDVKGLVPLGSANRNSPKPTDFFKFRSARKPPSLSPRKVLHPQE